MAEEPKDSTGSKPAGYRLKWPWYLLGALVLILLANLVFNWFEWPWRTKESSPPGQAKVSSTFVKTTTTTTTTARVIDYSQLKTDPNNPSELDRIIAARKKKFGLSSSVDLVVRPDETVIIGGQAFTVDDMLAGRKPKPLDPATEDFVPLTSTVQEENIGEADSTPPPMPKPTPPPAQAAKPENLDYYGVYIVRSGNNLWDIHFLFLREYMQFREISVSPLADEKTVKGQSSGVSRILKWAEGLVYIFNLNSRSLDKNIDFLEPQEKVVVFNISHLGRILGRIQEREIDQVRYDGQNLFLPEQAD